MTRSRLYISTAMAIVLAAAGSNASPLAHKAWAQETGNNVVDCTLNPEAEGCAQSEVPQPQVNQDEPATDGSVQEAVEESVEGTTEEAVEEVVEEPAAEEPVQETAEEPAAEEPAQETAEEPAAEEPVQETAEEPEAEEPAQETAEEPTAEEPATEEPVQETAEEPAAEEPVQETEAQPDPESEAVTETGESAVSEPAEPSADAPKPEPVAAEPIETQIEQAEESQTAVVPEEITAKQKKQLKQAERKRRKKSRERREELLGAAAAGAVIGALVPILGGRVVEDEGDRFVVERNGEYMVRRDDSALFRDNAERVEIEQLPRGRTRETVYRRNGSRIVTLRDPGGYVLMRKRIRRDGREIVLYDAFEEDRAFVDYDNTLPPIEITIPREQYIVPARGYGRRQLAEILAAEPVQPLPQRFTLREVRENERVRQYVRRIDLDTITFDSGSYYVSETQVRYLADMAGGMLDVIDRDPAAVFLIEGHTDAVGPDLYNLTLSDRRAETVARILVTAYGVPAENLVIEGYGEQFLKINTQGDERRNRRVTIRNISPLLQKAEN